MHAFIHRAIIKFSTYLSDIASALPVQNYLDTNPSAPQRTAATAEKHIASDICTARLVVRGRLNGAFIGALMDSITLRGKRTEPDLRSITEDVPARIGHPCSPQTAFAWVLAFVMAGTWVDGSAAVLAPTALDGRRPRSPLRKKRLLSYNDDEEIFRARDRRDSELGRCSVPNHTPRERRIGGSLFWVNGTMVCPGCRVLSD